MHPLPAFSPPADGPFERVVCAAVVRGGMAVVGLNPDFVVGRLPNETRVVTVLRHGDGTAAQINTLIKANKGVGIEVTIVGGGGEARAAAKKAIPWFTGGGVTVRHLADDESVEVFGTRVPMRPWATSQQPPPDWARFWGQIDEQNSAAHAFQAGLGPRRSPATFVLLGVNLAVYLLEVATGAPDYTPALVRLGALMRDRVFAGEVWRMVTSTFLHGSVIHLAFNMMVLVSLGTTMERILGTSRFVLLYGLAAIGGSIGSVLFMGEFSVGASGALWGLMAAQAVLALRGKGILPEDVRARMQKGAMSNLGLNVVNSLRAGVDWAAHAGGGVVGALVGLVGLLTLGLPRWAQVRPGEPVPPDRVPLFIHVGAVISAAVLGIGLVSGIAAGGVWKLNAAPHLTPVPIGAEGWMADVPDLLKRGDYPPDATDIAFGDVLADPVFVEVMVAPFTEPTDEAGRAAMYPELQTALGKADDAFKPTGAGTMVDVGGVTVLELSYASANGFLLKRALVVREAGIVRVDMVYTPNTPDSWVAVARAVALSGRAGS